MALHTLAVLVENSPGVLARVASLFSRRGYNIDSLAVGPTENPEISRITIVLNLEGHALDQVSAQLFKLINVIGIQEMKPEESYERELLLVKVSASESLLTPLVAKFGGRVVEEVAGVSVVEAVAASEKLEALLQELRSFGIKEIVQSGVIALERGVKTLNERTAEERGTSNAEITGVQTGTADYQN